MARHVMPQPATKADLDKMVGSLTQWWIVTMVVVAGLAIAIAKAV